MKTTKLFIGVALVAFLGFQATAQPTEKNQEVKKIVKTITIDDDGNTTIDSTIVYEGEDVDVFVHRMPANYRGGRQGFGQGQKGQSGKRPMSYCFQFDKMNEDSTQMMGMGCPNGNMRVFDFNSEDFNPQDFHGKRMMMMNRCENRGMQNQRQRMHNRQRGNGIDLNSPDIISFERETLKDGKEKITIIREKPEMPKKPEKENK